ncbi:hypothetical protein JAAARDRAFT_191893 [Jaapia argillacea MUCL 33604]|uniref:Uncharacterized protein n=1 Tax=Jaapia argillacea MUCL 33604 TaxID=933084 RepID=A0A067Q0C1_9AGAM|nr:hypothetical protein JAAARDRAFT_191893 [Jaapia argillacea MUCL 33604]
MEPFAFLSLHRRSSLVQSYHTNPFISSLEPAIPPRTAHPTSNCPSYLEPPIPKLEPSHLELFPHLELSIPPSNPPSHNTTSQPNSNHATPRTIYRASKHPTSKHPTSKHPTSKHPTSKHPTQNLPSHFEQSHPIPSLSSSTPHLSPSIPSHHPSTQSKQSTQLQPNLPSIPSEPSRSSVVSILRRGEVVGERGTGDEFGVISRPCGW